MQVMTNMHEMSNIAEFLFIVYDVENICFLPHY